MVLCGLTGCDYLDAATKLYTNTNDFRLYPLDVKKPSVVIVEDESADTDSDGSKATDASKKETESKITTPNKNN